LIPGSSKVVLCETSRLAPGSASTAGSFRGGLIDLGVKVTTGLRLMLVIRKSKHSCTSTGSCAHMVGYTFTFIPNGARRNFFT
jgi:hypothetical protein